MAKRRQMEKVVLVKMVTDMIIAYHILTMAEIQNINTFGQKPKKNVLKKLQIGEMNKMEFIQKTPILIGQSNNGLIIGTIIML